MKLESRSTEIPTSRIATFDVFDTVLARRLVLGPTVAQFALDVATARGVVCPASATSIEQYEKIAWSEVERPVGVVEIWLAWCRHRRIDERVAPRLAEIELEVETAFAAVCSPGHDRLSQARAAGKQIAFVSDTPWTEGELSSVLDEIGVLRSGDALFTSASRRQSKAVGDLFDEVVASLACRPEQVHHIGDDVIGDKRRAFERGMLATLLSQGRPTRWEQMLADAGSRTGQTSALLAGAARLARLDQAVDVLRPAAAEVSAGVAAPLLTAYVWWTIEQAIHCGLERLYFCGRDGELLLLISQEVRDLVDPAHRVELRYLRGSRRAWQLGSYSSLDDSDVSWLLDGINDLRTATSILRIDADAVPVDVTSVPAFVRRVSSDERLRSAVRASAEAAGSTMVKYLQQEGLLDDVAVGVVDVGWSGRAIRPLDSVLRGAGRTARLEYFFLGYERRGADPWSGPAPRAFVPGATSSAFLIECFCSSTTASAWAYRPSSEGGIEVVEGPSEGDGIRAWGIDEHRAVVLRAAAEFCTSVEIAQRLDPGWRPEMSACAPVLGSMLETLRRHPTAQEAAGWGSFPLADSHSNGPSAELAPPRRPVDALRGGNYVKSRWPAASAARSSRPSRYATRLHFRGGRLRSKLFRRG